MTFTADGGKLRRQNLTPAFQIRLGDATRGRSGPGHADPACYEAARLAGRAGCRGDAFARNSMATSFQLPRVDARNRQLG